MRCSVVVVTALIACFGSAPGIASAQGSFPRTVEGYPDLQGRWTMRTLTPFFRPQGVSSPTVNADEEKAMVDLIMRQRLAAERFDPGTSQPDGEGLAIVAGERRTSAVVSPSNGQLALTLAGEARLQARMDGNDGPEARPVNERCIADAGRAPYRVMSGEMFFEIVQTSDYLVVHKEGMDPPRIFPVSSGTTTSVANSWAGVSRHHWEGDSFVIETTGFRPDDTNRRISGPGSAGFPISPQTRITEWLIPTSADMILYRYKVEDPTLYAEPLVVELPMVRTQQRLFESACHEGNLSLQHTLQAARYAD